MSREPTDPPTVHDLHGPADLTEARSLIAAQQETIGAPVLDEAEQHRLDVAADGGVRAAGWSPVLARVGAQPVGYGAVLVGGGDPSVPGSGDLAPARDAVGLGQVLPALVDALAQRLPGAQVWMRHVDVAGGDLDGAVEAGARIDRQLAVLGRALDVSSDGHANRDAPDVPDGITIRASRRGEDDEGVVVVLAAAYEGTGDGGWTLERFLARQQLDFYDPADLLVAARNDGSLAGLHWLKRRDADTGEVYNLAVHPDAQGLRLGPALLTAGLDHLVAVGCREVILWVDRANERAVRLYETAGFATRWDDVALRLPA
ncbi:MAG: GNAT family N-acetyltransferase [Nitriliruptoraceae bacterium]|nr:GNAT family N-acetyltransferase [Nitriliruptoraceae bacterium]